MPPHGAANLCERHVAFPERFSTAPSGSSGAFGQSRDLIRLVAVVRYRYLIYGVLWMAAGFSMVAMDTLLGMKIFGIQIGTLWLPLWPAAILLGGMYLWYHVWVQRNIRLTREEVEKYLDRLEIAMPEILDMLEAGTSVRKVAQRVEAKHGVPKVVTLKFIIAMGKEWKSRD